MGDRICRMPTRDEIAKEQACAYLATLDILHDNSPEAIMAFETMRERQAHDLSKFIAAALDKYAEGLRTYEISIRFDGPPGPISGRFIEVEHDGKSINAGSWIQDGEDWLLILKPELYTRGIQNEDSI